MKLFIFTYEKRIGSTYNICFQTENEVLSFFVITFVDLKSVYEKKENFVIN